MSAEFDDVLTNQPVVIDNVRLFHSAFVSPTLKSSIHRALEQSRLALLGKTIPNASFRLCAS